MFSVKWEFPPSLFYFYCLALLTFVFVHTIFAQSLSLIFAFFFITCFIPRFSFFTRDYEVTDNTEFDFKIRNLNFISSKESENKTASQNIIS